MSPRATRNSRNLISRRSIRPAWETPHRPSRSGRTKRKSYKENSDSESDSDASPAKRFKDVDFFRDDEVGMADDDDGEYDTLTSPSTVSDDLQGEIEDVDCLSYLDKMPPEIHGIIISYMERDSDIIRYGMVCKRLHSAMDFLVWSERYAKVYDVDFGSCVQGRNGITLSQRETAAEEYRSRHISFNHGWLTFSRRNLRFEQDEKGKEKLWCMQMEFLQHLRNMIYESNAKRVTENGEAMIFGKNFEIIQKMTSMGSGTNYIDILDSLLERDDFTTCPYGYRCSDKLKMTQTVQLCLLPMILDPRHNETTLSHWDASQKLVYSLNARMFEGFYKNRIKLNFFVNTLNFFKFHFKTGNGEGILHEAYSKLSSDQRPQMWCGKVPVGTQSMTGHWKGAWTYLSSKDIKVMRSNYASQESYQDTVDDENNPFFDMTFFSDESRFGQEHWPAAWDLWVLSDPYSIPNNANNGLLANRPEVKHFWGTIRGSKNGHLFGRSHAISNQESFHGWQHISMIVCFSDDQGAFDNDDIWIYEGIALPGNRIIMGRWASPQEEHPLPEEHQCGPFIFWNVDRSVFEPAITADEALEFAATIDNPMFSGLPILDVTSV